MDLKDALFCDSNFCINAILKYFSYIKKNKDKAVCVCETSNNYKNLELR